MVGADQIMRLSAGQEELTGLPSASTRAWILVSIPHVIGPIAWSSPAFFGASAVLMGTHNGAVDHRIFIVGVSGEDAGRSSPRHPI